jgi:hypothetical protein
VALGQVFSEYFGFPCQSSFHQFLDNRHHLSSGAGTIGQLWPQYPNPTAQIKKNDKQYKGIKMGLAVAWIACNFLQSKVYKFLNFVL